MFAVTTYAGSREQAKRISDNWNENAEILYPELLKLLSENKNKK